MSYIFRIFMAVYLCSNLLLLAASFRGHHRRPSHPVPQHPSLLHWCKREVTPSLHTYEPPLRSSSFFLSLNIILYHISHLCMCPNDLTFASLCLQTAQFVLSLMSPNENLTIFR